MKLYYSAGSCSTSCHISLEESGLKYEAVQVDWDKDNDPNIRLVTRLNPLGTLPVMVLDRGEALTQNIAIHTYVADQVPDRRLLPRPGTPERALAMNWLSFVAADLHKSFSPLFAADSFSNDPTEKGRFRDWALGNLRGYLEFLDKNLEGKDYLTGKDFTVADAYCFVVTNWTKYMEIPIDRYRNLSAYLQRVASRPAVGTVLKQEGLT